MSTLQKKKKITNYIIGQITLIINIFKDSFVSCHGYGRHCYKTVLITISMVVGSYSKTGQENGQDCQKAVADDNNQLTDEKGTHNVNQD